MNNYTITKLVAKLGYGLSIAFILLAGIAGWVGMKGISGAVIGALSGLLLSIPTMLFCELTIAVVRTEVNTRGNAGAVQEHKNERMAA